MGERTLLKKLNGLTDDVPVPDHAGVGNVHEDEVGVGLRFHAGHSNLAVIRTGNQHGKNRINGAVARNDSEFITALR